MTTCVLVSHKYADYRKRETVACIDCGKERIVCIIKGKPQNLRCKSCAMKLSHKTRDRSYYKTGKDCYQWTGGKHKTKYGYIKVWIDKNNKYFPMANKQYIFEHRLVIAQHIGRCLYTWEIVHHINGIKDDNRLDNLELLPSKAYHVVDSYTKSYITRLENKIKKLETVIEDRMCLNFP